MPRITSVNWNEESGVCEKHHIQMLPCPSCLAEKDKDVQLIISEVDVLYLEAEVLLPKEERLGIGGYLAPDEQWLVERYFPQKSEDEAIDTKE